MGVFKSAYRRYHVSMTPDSDAILWHPNPTARRYGLSKASTAKFSSEQVQTVRAFHRSLPAYRPTPLASLSKLARRLGVSGLYVKDESRRFDLKAFKVLGASYALWRTLARDLLGISTGASFCDLQQPEFKKHLSATTCITATDGNHGRALAWAARQLGCRAVVLMPQGTAEIRLDHVRRLGAKAETIDGNYDEAVRRAAATARSNRWLLIQDTAWSGYITIPCRIMQGYLTLFDEALEQLDGVVPTHIFIQCGVGSLASALQAFLVQRYGAARPKLVVVEPKSYAGFYRSVRIGDGRPHGVEGEAATIMAGLACGEPSTIAWEILRDYADVFVACPDTITVKAMRLLARPLSGDPPIVSGESGAVTTGLIHEILDREENRPLSDALGLDGQSEILLFSTEGDTDPEMYREIVAPQIMRSVSGDKL
jgi:diaminopropionate ammonia-lyase